MLQVGRVRPLAQALQKRFGLAPLDAWADAATQCVLNYLGDDLERKLECVFDMYPQLSLDLLLTKCSGNRTRTMIIIWTCRWISYIKNCEDLPVQTDELILLYQLELFSKVKREEKQKLPCPHLREIILRCLAWGFSSSGVERTFAAGGWLKARREVTVALANDELRAHHFLADDQDKQLSLQPQPWLALKHLEFRDLKKSRFLFSPEA